MTTPPPLHLRMGARGSLLSRTQSGIVAKTLEAAHPGLSVETVIIKTTGDQITQTPLHNFGGKGLFTKEIEQALLDGAIDFAVHSYKDMPTTMPLVDISRLIVTATPPREDPRDVLAATRPMTLPELPPSARVGTGSLRRRCQLLSLRPDLSIEPIRGNIDTRLRKLREGQYDAVVLAYAGIRRCDLFDPRAMAPIDPGHLLPAPGQGALALQCRADDTNTRALLGAINDSATSSCVAAERKLVELLNGDCLSPIAALARIDAGTLHLRSAVGGRGGSTPVLYAEASAPVAEPMAAAQRVFELLAGQGVEKLLSVGACAS